MLRRLSQEDEGGTVRLNREKCSPGCSFFWQECQSFRPPSCAVPVCSIPSCSVPSCFATVSRCPLCEWWIFLLVTSSTLCQLDSSVQDPPKISFLFLGDHKFEDFHVIFLLRIETFVFRPAWFLLGALYYFFKPAPHTWSIHAKFYRTSCHRSQEAPREYLFRKDARSNFILLQFVPEEEVVIRLLVNP